MNTQELRALMIENAAELNRLNAAIKANHKRYLDDCANIEAHEAWERACAEWHERYTVLCIPGGWEPDFEEKVVAGDVDAVERALCFLEVRPYFFRSGYHWNTILQKCKRAPMSGDQAERFAALMARYRAWKAQRDLDSKRGVAFTRDYGALISRCKQTISMRVPDCRLADVETVGDLYSVFAGG